jgi:glyoxylase-like metal-dependent hydrolase (beta-lactamase superfamily II)
MRGESRPSRHFQLKELAPGVHAAVAIDGGYALSNSAIVDLGGSTLIFDTGLTPRSARALAHAARRLTGRPADYLVNSHWHHDHIRGNQVFANRRIIATSETWELIRTRGAEDVRSDRTEAKSRWDDFQAGKIPTPPFDRAVFRGWFGGIVDSLPELRLTLPNLTFDSELVLRGSRRTARVLSYGGGHSPSDAFVYLPDDRIAFLGDLLSNGYHPWLADGNPDTLVEILDRIGSLGPRTFLPGHGAPGGPRVLTTMREYVTTAQRIAERHRRAHRPRKELVGLGIPERFRGWKFRDFFPDTLAFLYRFASRHGLRA